MDAEYTISEDDYVNAMRLYSKFTPKAIILLGLIFFTLLIAFLFGTPLIKSGALGGLIGGLVVIVLARLVLNPLLARRHYRKYKAIQSPIHVTLKDEGVSFATQDSSGTVRWETIYKWRQNDRYLLIYPMPRLYHIVPKSIEASGFDIAGLVSLLETRVGKAS